MDQRREHGVQISERRERDSRCIDTQGPGEISHNDAVAAARDLDHLDHLQEVVAEQQDVGAFACDLGAGPHRYSDVGLHQRWRIIDPVSDHRDRFPRAAKTSNTIQLLPGEKFRLHLVHLKLLSDGPAN